MIFSSYSRWDDYQHSVIETERWVVRRKERAVEVVTEREIAEEAFERWVHHNHCHCLSSIRKTDVHTKRRRFSFSVLLLLQQTSLGWAKSLIRLGFRTGLFDKPKIK